VKCLKEAENPVKPFVSYVWILICFYVYIVNHALFFY